MAVAVSEVQKSLELPVLVEIHDKNGLIYTGHAVFYQIRQEISLDGYQLGSLDINTSVAPWRADIQINGVGGFTVRQGKVPELSTVRVSLKDFWYVQELEERVAQLEAELANAKVDLDAWASGAFG